MAALHALRSIRVEIILTLSTQNYHAGMVQILDVGDDNSIVASSLGSRSR